jgi:4-amino-4-deoxychorismate lyase
MASQRWARRIGYDDMLWVSSDGYALEGPTSTLVWLDGDTLCTVPAAHTGILPGTTAAWLLSHAGDLGWRSEERMIRPEQLATASGVWFLSSVRGPAPVRELDGVALARSDRERVLRDLLGYPG